MTLVSLLLTLTSYAQSDGVLTGLSLSEGALNPAFDSATRNYTATVPYDTTSVTVTATAPSGMPIMLNGATIASGVPSLAQNLDVGENTLRVTVFSDSATIYDVVVTRDAAAAPALTGLALSSGALNPVFDTNTKSYTATVPFSTTEVTVTATAEAGMLLNLNGEGLTSGQASSPQTLTVGENSLSVSVISGNEGAAYTVTLTREDATAPTLTGLSLSEGTLDPAFDSNTKNYAVTVPYETSSVTVTATAPDGTIMTLNGAAITSGQASAPQSLTVGTNNLEIALFTNSASIYTVVVTRAAGSAPILTGLTLSAGTLTPAFNSDTKSYTASVPYAVNSVTVTATAPAGMILNLDGAPLSSGVASSPRNLSVGENNLGITVISGAAGEIYNVVVTREPAVAGPVLTGLSLSQGTLSPEFGAGTTSYTATVPYSTSSVAVTASALPGTILTLNGAIPLASGVASPLQSLSVGPNTLVVSLFTSSSSSYTVVVTREPAPTPILTNLVLSQGMLSPAFGSGVKSYTATVPYSVDTLTLTATAPDGIVISLDGALLESGQPSAPQDVYVGSNLFSVAVLSGSAGDTYQITVTRDAAPAPVLTGLSLSAGNLNPVFDSATKTYTATVPTETTSLTVTATADNGTIITLNGETITSGQASPPQALELGENGLAVTVFTSTATSYNVVVTRGATEPKFTSNVISNGILTLTWTGTGTLQSSPDFGVWKSIPTSGNSYSTPVAGVPRLFYRLEQ